jgi:IS5 family transposase
MYKSTEQQITFPHEFFMPFGGQLNPKNKWCQLAAIIPWAEVERKYVQNFKSHKGQVAYSVRMALGALIIQNRKSLSDRETVEEITENPYLQFFVGLPAFIKEAPFDASLMTHFRKRLGKDIINEVNEMIAGNSKSSEPKDPNGNPPSGNIGNSSEEKALAETPSEESSTERKNSGKLILDATCAPADIHYPTDLWLLNKAREAIEEIIDALHKPHVGSTKKPRTYRNNARKNYLNVDKKKRTSAREIRKGIGQQLRYLRRDFKVIKKLSLKSSLTLLNKRQYRNLLVSQEIYRQQLEMYEKRKHTIEDRIVSLHMPFVRPIVRGKAKADVEFGAKLAISIVDGFSYLESVSFDAFNEGTTLIQSLKNYYQKYGFYPEAVMADKIYRNRDNLQFCKKHHIRLSGPPLGRPKNDSEVLKEQKKLERQDVGIRNAVEGKFGEGKRLYGLGRIMARLKETSETVIAMQLLVMNLERRLRILLLKFFRAYFRVARLEF